MFRFLIWSFLFFLSANPPVCFFDSNRVKEILGAPARLTWSSVHRAFYDFQAIGKKITRWERNHFFPQKIKNYELPNIIAIQIIDKTLISNLGVDYEVMRFLYSDSTEILLIRLKSLKKGDLKALACDSEKGKDFSQTNGRRRRHSRIRGRREGHGREGLGAGESLDLCTVAFYRWSGGGGVL